MKNVSTLFQKKKIRKNQNKSPSLTKSTVAYKKQLMSI